MANVDYSFNRNRLIGLYLKENDLDNVLTPQDFDINFEFNDPVRIDTTPTTRNTYIQVTAKLDSRYYGIKTLRYNRIHLTDLPNITVDKTSEVSLYELLPIINSKYGLFLTQFDIEDQDISSEPSGPLVINLNIKNTSLLLYSGTKIVTT